MLPRERTQGVMIPESQLRDGERGTPSTVQYIVPMTPYAVRYFDEQGVPHNTIVYKCGDTVYFDRNAERWASSLLAAAKYIRDAVNAEHAAFLSPAAPGEDPVDVIAREGANEANP